MSAKLKNNDRVTVVLQRGGLSRTIVNRAGVTKFSAIDDDRSVHVYADEGITWARGRVYEDSVEGKALLAAYALAPKESWFTTVGMMPMTGFVPRGRGNYDPKNELGE